MEPPDFVVIGHLTKDLTDGGYLLGGAAYSARTAARLGRRVGLVTSFGPDLEFSLELEGTQVACQPSVSTTVFRNLYHGGHREQFLLSQAQSLGPEDVPGAWRAAALVHLAPIVGEVAPEVIELFPSSRKVATPQGWMRRWGAGGRVQPGPWTGAGWILSRLDAAILSWEDVAGDEALVEQWAAWARCLVLTGGQRGVWVYYEGRREHVPAFRPARMVDPTGAGDAFAAAFLVRWAECGDPLQAARFASCLASFVVEGEGLAGIPGPMEVQERWASL